MKQNTKMFEYTYQFKKKHIFKTKKKSLEMVAFAFNVLEVGIRLYFEDHISKRINLKKIVLTCIVQL